MRTLTKEQQEKLSPGEILKKLQEGNERFVSNLRLNRNLLQQVNETREGQHPFAVIISCMDSRTSAELIFDQGLGDIFSIRIAGNVVTDEIIGSTEFGCKVVGAKVVAVIGHTGCGAINGAIADVKLGRLESVTSKIRKSYSPESMEFKKMGELDQRAHVTERNVLHSIATLREASPVLRELEKNGQLQFAGGVYDIASGKVSFINASR
jgi:carbonic anhydrase